MGSVEERDTAQMSGSFKMGKVSLKLCVFITTHYSKPVCRPGFPGSKPVLMDVQNIRFLNEKPYRVSWKADGTR